MPSTTTPESELALSYSTSVGLPPELGERLRSECNRHGLSQTRVLIRALVRYLPTLEKSPGFED
jgi:hypothetical protein